MRPYSWGSDASGLGACEWVLASDVTHATAGHAPLCASLAQLLRAPSTTGCRVVIAHEHRVASTGGAAAAGAVEAAGAYAASVEEDDEKLAHFVAAAEGAGLSVATLSEEVVEGGRRVALLQVEDARREEAMERRQAVGAPRGREPSVADAATTARLRDVFNRCLDVQQPWM